MKKTMALILFLAMISAAGFLYAEDTSFRCGNDLITMGYSMYQVRNSCGAPDTEQVVGSRETSRIRMDNRNKSETTVNITEWTYNRDSGVYILTFEGSTLVKKEYRRLD